MWGTPNPNYTTLETLQNQSARRTYNEAWIGDYGDELLHELIEQKKNVKSPSAVELIC